ncbi:hypothetical protein OOT46_18015 [Aquabacterium sp. A7-Y]|uniref:hypothetical protein n=1 Tax=Aquabacterium sp. A7-Y TaxID=1349605 RepID=UPI00223CFFD0|nr:hypothetical protein [Aquabacterium sp. A7-Y]MCW7539736.1 hypothetical protein [Aquabacterium sp. A7-Y]
MNVLQSKVEGAPSHELRFQSLFQAGRGYSFPCDGAGRVDLDALSERARANYLYARATVGREFATPVVRPSTDRAESALELAA